MFIFLAATDDVIAPGGLAVLAAISVVTLSILQRAKFFSPRDGESKARLFPAESVGPLGFNAGIAVFAYFLAAAAVGVYLRATHPELLGNKETGEVPPNVLILLSCVVPACSLIALLVGLRFIVPNGFTRIGLAGTLRPRAVAAGVGVILAAYPLLLLVVNLTELVYRRLGWQHESAHELLKSMGEVQSPLEKFLAIFAAVVLAPLNEEILFRGHLQAGIRRLLRPRRKPATPGGFEVVSAAALPPLPTGESPATAFAPPALAVRANAGSLTTPPFPAPADTVPADADPLTTPLADVTLVAPVMNEAEPAAFASLPAAPNPAVTPHPIAAGSSAGPASGIPFADVPINDSRTFVISLVAVVVTSIFFASVHPSWSRPAIFILSLFLGLAYERRGNLWTTITMHALFNGVMTAIYLAMQ